MVYVILTQHGEAKKKEEDPQRNLTERGREETRKVAEFFVRNINIKISRIIHSTKLRAKQTAEILASIIKPVKGISEEANLEPNADPSPWIDKINNLSENIIIVGHLPHLNKLLSLLVVNDSEKEIVKFRYSNMICLESSDIGHWRILWIIRPDIIK